jgi:hypothetical protein
MTQKLSKKKKVVRNVLRRNPTKKQTKTEKENRKRKREKRSFGEVLICRFKKIRIMETKASQENQKEKKRKKDQKNSLAYHAPPTKSKNK